MIGYLLSEYYLERVLNLGVLIKIQDPLLLSNAQQRENNQVR